MSAPEITRLAVDGTWNFREAGGGALRAGALYRSDALDRLSRQGRAAVAALGIRSVIDLRSRLDRRMGGRDRLRGTEATPVFIPIAGVGPRTDPETLTLPGLYRTFLTAFAPQFRAAIAAIANADGPTLVHCTAGKDRTGVLCALVLGAVGADRDVIIEDYARTEANLAGVWRDRMLRRVRRFGVRVTDEFAVVVAGSPPDAMAATLDWLDDEHGGMTAYLDAIGVDAALRDRLRAALT